MRFYLVEKPKCGDNYVCEFCHAMEYLKICSAVVVEKLDGSLWCTLRTTTGYVCESFSHDGGKTWTVGRQTDIKNPASRFFITRLQSGKLMMVYNDQNSWNHSGTMGEKLCYYAKWCEAGESYSGRANIAVAKAE